MQIVVDPVKQAAESRCSLWWVSQNTEHFSLFTEDGCQSNGPPVIQAYDSIFLRYGHNGGFFEAWGNHRQREGKIENVFKNPG